jgi:hypothetical protein
MRQNMAKLQDTLRQMQEQQQAYEAARQAKTHTQQFYAQPQVFPPHAVPAPVYFTKPAPAVAVHPTPQVISAPVRQVAPQAQYPKPTHTPQAMMEAASTL